MRATLISIPVALSAVTLATAAMAGGTTDIQVIERLLQSQPQTKVILKATFDFPDAVFAETRLGNRFAQLSAERLGPYTFVAKPKAPGAAAEVEVVVCTTARFLTKDGKELKGDAIFKAIKVEERLSSIQLRDRQSQPMSPNCPSGA